MPFLAQIVNPKWILKNEAAVLQLYRKCSDLSIVKTQLEVPTFCDIHVDLRCKVRIKPLNVHKYHNSNAFLLQTDQKYDSAIEHYIDGNKVIVRSQENLNPTTLCSIKAPVKANLHVKAKNDVSIGFFHGDKVSIKTEGNIFVDRFQGDTIDVSTTKGNIVFNNYIQAANIIADVTDGSIVAGKLQGLNLKLKALGRGNLSVESSYCNESIFVVEKGNMNLRNIHRNCKIFLMKGNLDLSAFDGQLSAIIDTGSADVYLTRVTGNSDITLKDNGKLNLKLTDACQDFTAFKIFSPNISISENVKSETVKDDNFALLKPVRGENSVLVNCTKASIRIDSMSWQEMVEQKLKK